MQTIGMVPVEFIVAHGIWGLSNGAMRLRYWRWLSSPACIGMMNAERARKWVEMRRNPGPSRTSPKTRRKRRSGSRGVMMSREALITKARRNQR